HRFRQEHYGAGIEGLSDAEHRGERKQWLEQLRLHPEHSAEPVGSNGKTGLCDQRQYEAEWNVCLPERSGSAPDYDLVGAAEYSALSDTGAGRRKRSGYPGKFPTPV